VQKNVSKWICLQNLGPSFAGSLGYTIPESVISLPVPDYHFKYQQRQFLHDQQAQNFKTNHGGRSPNQSTDLRVLHPKLPGPVRPPRNDQPRKCHELNSLLRALGSRSNLLLVRQRAQPPRCYHHRRRQESLLRRPRSNRTSKIQSQASSGLSSTTSVVRICGSQ
jgi:hypothetical protein